MLTFSQYLKARYATQISDNRSKMLGEGLELQPAELIDELMLMNAKSIFAQIVMDTDDEVTLSLRLKKSTQPMEQGETR